MSDEALPRGDDAGEPAPPVAEAGRNEINRRLAADPVGVVKDYLGRGPTKAEAHYVDDMVVAVFRESLTKAERTLAASGHEDAIRESRRRFQSAMGPPFIEIVQRRTGRVVQTYLSDHDIPQDVAVECFLLKGPATRA